MPDQPRSEAWAILSEEIARLPETYRAPVVLCYLEAMSYQAAAASLGVTEDTVRGRLARARERLRKSLARRGVEVPAIVAAARPAIPAVVVRHRIGAGDGPRRDRPLDGRGGGPRRDLPIGDLLVRKDVQDHDADQIEGGRGRPGARSRRGRRDRVGPAARGRARRAVGPRDEVGTAGESRPRQGGQPDRRLDPRRRPGRQEGDHRRPEAALHPPVVGEPEAGRPARTTGPSASTWSTASTYKVTASGEAFMSEQTGLDADPFPGVVVLYPTDEEDCYAIARSSWRRGSRSPSGPRGSSTRRTSVYLMAFFLDAYWPTTPSGGATRSPSRRPANRPSESTRSRPRSTGS